MQQDELYNSVQKKSYKKNLFPFLIYFFSYLLFLIPFRDIIFTYTIAYICTSLLFILLSFFILKSDLEDKLVYILLITSMLLRIAVIFIPPAGSDDYYRYLWDGKVMANGINPYRYAPSDPALEKLHSDRLPSLVNFPDIKTVYPPLSELIFLAAYISGGESFYGLKFILLIFEIFSIFISLKILRKTEIPFKYILLYALCPLPLFQFFIDAHIDAAGISLLLFFIFFYLNKKHFLSYIFLGLSLCVKPAGLIIIPLIFFDRKGLLPKVTSAAVPVFLCSVFYLVFSFSGNPLEALGNFTINWTFNGFIFNIINSFINDNQGSRLLCTLLLVIAYMPLLFSKKEFLTKVYNSVFLLLLFSPIVHPWYVSWLAILLPLIPRWSGILYSGLVSITAATILHYQLYGEWNDYPAVWILEYIPVLLFFIIELVRGRTLLNAPVHNI